MHPFVIGTILAQPGEPGFPWQWDAFGGGPGKNGGNASASMYPVSDGTPHPKQKVCCAARPRPPGALRLGAPSLARAVARAHTPSRAGLLSRAFFRAGMRQWRRRAGASSGNGCGMGPDVLVVRAAPA